MQTNFRSLKMLVVAILPLCTLLSACQDETKIDPAYMLTKHPDAKNMDSLKVIQMMLTKISSSAGMKENVKHGLRNYLGHALDGQRIDVDPLTSPPVLVNVKDSVAKLFDPELQPCPIPEKVLKRLKKLKSENKVWVPKELASQLNGMPDEALYFQGTGLTVQLHTVEVKHVDNTVENTIIVGSPTFYNIDVADFLSKAINNFGYTLDCSGLMSASIEGTATVPGSDITSAAALALNKKTSMFIGGGVVISPLYAAYFGEASGINLPKETRREILSAMVQMPGIIDTDKLKLVMSYEVIWASSKGEQGFNGSAELSSKGGLGIGIAQVSGRGNVSGTVSRNTSFSTFDTYVTSRQRLNAPVTVTVANIKTLIQQLNAQ